MESITNRSFTPSPKFPRWIKAPQFAPGNLMGKTVFAEFTFDGISYEGKGEIRTRHNNTTDLWTVDLCFTRAVSESQRQDMIFFLSTRQAKCLKPAPAGSVHDYLFVGHLSNDAPQDDDAPVTITQIAEPRAGSLTCAMTAEVMGVDTTINISQQLAQGIGAYVGKPLDQPTFYRLISSHD